MRVDEVMARSVVRVDRSESLDRARSLMAEYGIHHLPVFDQGHLIGVLSSTDIAARGPDGASVGEMMTEPVVTVPPNLSVREAAALMDRRHLHCIPVIERDRLVGIVTESDLLRLLSGTRGAPLRGFRLWAAWTLITIAGQVAAVAAVALLHSFADAIAAGQAHDELGMLVGTAAQGTLIALVQLIVLRRSFPDVSRPFWVVAGGAGATAAWLAGVLSIDVYGATGAAAIVLSGMVAGLIIGAVQWQVLSRKVEGASLWIPANAVAWTLGLWIILAGAAWQGAADEWMVATIGVLTAIGTGLAVGALTGLALTRMRPREEA